MVVKNLISEKQIQKTISRIKNFDLVKQFSELAEVKPGHLLLGWLQKIALSGKEIANPEAYLSSALREGWRPEINFNELVKAFIPEPHMDEFDQHFRKEFWPLMEQTGKLAGFLLDKKMLSFSGWDRGTKWQEYMRGEAFRDKMIGVDRIEAIYKEDPEEVLDSVFAYIWPIMLKEL